MELFRSSHILLSPRVQHEIGYGNWVAIPIVTTTPGRRGYDWNRGALSIAASPDEFCDLCLKMMDPSIAQQARAEVIDVAESSPTIAGIGQRLASLLEVD